ncbi:hypothetical protein [Polluticaenibacter yanchengensis]|uniref:Uncharacterized protein n=1 Tax=Polluticaenibacter yanchengensis TaxID=3014562 RepID=A0ABT4ULA0_9BACT|nr:hypothetical protein [Chitinophagaceae bacterium LY-5]
MKNLKVNFFLIAAIAIATVAMSFKMSTTTTVWHYEGLYGTPGDYTDTDNWKIGNQPDNDCALTGETLCEIEVEAANINELKTFMSGETNTSISSIATKRDE